MKKTNSLYQKLIEALIEEIESNPYGTKLPSERKLCDAYDVSRTTVRNAIDYLEFNGYVKRIQGKGTFSKNRYDNRKNLSNYYSFTEATKALGMTPKSIITEYHVTKPNAEISNILNVSESDFVIKFVRLRLANNEPQLLETTYMNYNDFPEISKKLLEEIPLYDILIEKYNRPIKKVNEKFTVSLVSNEEAEILNIYEYPVALEIQRFSFDENDKIVEYTISYANGEKFEYGTTYFTNK